jgi:hypothetical protein
LSVRQGQVLSGEQAAVAGMLNELRPRVVVELGDFWCGEPAGAAPEVHRLAGAPPDQPARENLIFHAGRAEEVLPELLAEFAGAGRNVDLALVQGGRSELRREIELLLDSPALGSSVLLVDDATRPAVRRELDAVPFATWPKVARVDLDWIPGRLPQAADEEERWHGLGLVVVDSQRLAYVSPTPYEARYRPSAPLLWSAGRQELARRHVPAGLTEDEELATLRERHLECVGALARARVREVELAEVMQSLSGELALVREGRERAERVRAEVMASASWKITMPLRLVKRLARTSR